MGQPAAYNKILAFPTRHSPSSPQTHQTWVLGLQGHKLPEWCHVGRLRRWGRWRRVKNVVVTGDEVGVGMVGHRELLHGTCLDQLLRESKAGPMHQQGQGTPPAKGSYYTQT